MSSHTSRRRSGKAKPLTRSSSLLGALKNIVTAPLAWFGSNDDFEDSAGKRGRNTALDIDARDIDEGSRTVKRKRVHSPSPQPQYQPQYQPPPRTNSGYLDPPTFHTNGSFGGSGSSRHLTAHARASSLAPPTTKAPSPRFDRHTHSPVAVSSYVPPVMVSRTNPVCPPPRGDLSRDSSMNSLPISRDVSMEYMEYIPVAPHEMSMSPSHVSFRMRTTATPQPTNQGFGPSFQRNMSEPPPLDALISHPIFVRPPVEVESSHQPAHPPPVTLGAIVGTSRAPRPLARQHTQLILTPNAGATTDIRSSVSRPSHPAEKALHELDIYKTPLLPTRLRGSSTIPDMFKPVPHLPKPVLSSIKYKDREDKPRLGMEERVSKPTDSDREEGARKPYAGRGGMKKLLARRKTEEEAAEREERANAIDVEEDEDQNSRQREPSPEISPVPKIPAFPPPTFETPTGGKISSLRVGRNKSSRNHIARPVVTQNKFSAIYDDDEEVDETEDGGKAKDTAFKPIFEMPKGFSFANDNPPAPQQKDDDELNEPPIAALPFSLSKPSASSPPASNSFSVLAPVSFASTSTPVSVFGPASTPSQSDNAEKQSMFGQIDHVGKASLLEETNSAKPSLFGQTDSATPLPFSLGQPPLTPSVQTEKSGTPATPFPTVPSISLIPPSPSPAESAAATNAGTTASTSGSSNSIPNFFANSPLLSKVASTPVPAPTPTPVVTSAPAPFRFGTSSVASSHSEETDEKKDSSDKGNISASAPLLFGSSASSTNMPKPLFGGISNSAFGSTGSGMGAVESGTNTPMSAFSSFGASMPVSTPMTETPANKPVNNLFGGAPSVSSVPHSMFGGPTKAAELPKTTPTQTFTFDQPAIPSEPSTTTSPLFTFGASKTDAHADAKSTTEAAKPPPLFGTLTASPFGASAPTSTQSLFGTTQTSSLSSSPSPFGGFGSTSGSTDAAKSPFNFGQSAAVPTTPTASTPATEASKSVFGSTSGGGGTFLFGQNIAAVPSTPPASTADKKSPFVFGPSTPTNGGSTLFGAPAGGSNGTDISSKPFGFGMQSERFVTPPDNSQEIQMDESPTRNGGMDYNGDGKSEPPKSTFPFGTANTTTPASPFGQSSNASSFMFGSGAAPASPFGTKQETKPEVKPAMTFGSFGQSTSTGSGFGFGQKATENTQSPGNLFGSPTTFGQPSTPTNTSSPFGFSAPATLNTTFSRPTSNAGSAPGSPSTFNPPSSFNFATPTSSTAPSNPFAFGASRPASPANTTPGLPQPPGSSGGGFFGSSTPSTPASTLFGTPTTPVGGTPLFTMGSAPPSTPQSNNGRPIRKLPRRGGKR